MTEIGLLIIILIAFLFAMFEKKITAAHITAPMFFIAAGFIVEKIGFVQIDQAKEALYVVAEIALVILLFLDASQIELGSLRKHHNWPARMLFIGIPLAVLIGTFASWLYFPSWPLVVCALVAALLAPTDAALGQAVVSNPLVPERVRHGLTAESGLNDGMALPIILLFASLTAEVTTRSGNDWLLFGAAQLLMGLLAGIIIGFLGGKLMLYCNDRNYTSAVYEGVGTLALAGSAYLFSGVIGGNGFIAAFVAGLTFGNIVKGGCKFVYTFTESEGQMLVWAAFFLLGLSLLPDALADLSWPVFMLIMTSLLVVRPLAIWISLIGSSASPLTRLFFGWFGPRGLATALFALLIIDQINEPYAETVMAIAINAVWISALLHGISAAPAATYYARKIGQTDDCGEKKPTPKMFEEK